MVRLVKLETFDVPPAGRPHTEDDPAEIEEMRLGAYELGYSAGWDDAVAAQEQELAHLRTDLGRNLREMAMTYDDARRHILASIEPLLNDMIVKVLPVVAHKTLAPMVIEALAPLAEDLSSGPVTVLTAPCHRETVERLLSTASLDLPVSVRAEDSLGIGQAIMKFGGQENLLDLDGVIEAIGRAVSSFFQLDNEERPHHG